MPPSGPTIFERREFIYASAYKSKSTLSLIFSFNFRLLSAFIASLTEREILTSDSSILNFRQRVTSQHTVSAKELYTKALTGWGR